LEKQLLLFGLMKKAGRLSVGDEPVTDALTFGNARVMALASDAAENTVRRFERLAEEVGVPVVHLHATKKELGESLGRATAAVIAVCDIGFAARFLELACEEYPGDEELAAAREKMTKKAERLVEEQKKKRREEKEAKKHPNKARAQKPAADEAVQADTGSVKADRKTEKKPEGAKKNGKGDSGVRTYVPEYMPKKVYGKVPGRQKSQTSIGDRRREDAEKKAEKYGYGAGNSANRGYNGNKSYSRQGSSGRQQKSGRPGGKTAVHGKGGKA